MRTRKTRWSIGSFDLVWQGRQLVDAKAYDVTKSCSTHRHFRTGRKAWNVVQHCPVGTFICLEVKINGIWHVTKDWFKEN